MLRRSSARSPVGGDAPRGVIILAGGIIGFLCTTVHEAPLSVHKKPRRIGPGLGELRRITLLGSRVNKALAGVAHTKKKPEPPCRGLRLRCATSSSLEEMRRIYPTALSG